MLRTVIILSLFLASCAGSVRIPVPQSLVTEAEVSGLSDVRFWGDQTPKDLEPRVQEVVSQIRKTRPEVLKQKSRVVNLLAISGGGANGAFGAGLLNGWTDHGSRPEFEVVTGISTGALIAPFVFLGPEYDHWIKKIYTTYSTDDLLKKNVIAGVLGGTAITDSAPLFEIITQIVDKKLLAMIAAEHSKGRRLFVGTTNLDAERPVIWDMGAIAASGQKNSPELFRKVLLASASIGGVFPPVKIKVEADGKVFEEIHVDGGTTNQVFLFPSQTKVGLFDKKTNTKSRRRVYIIRNAHIEPEYDPVKSDVPSIAARSISSLLKTQGRGDLLRIYELSRRNRMDYNLASLPKSFTLKSKEPFDLSYMRALYDKAYELGKNGYKWSKLPPQLGN